MLSFTKTPSEDWIPVLHRGGESRGPSRENGSRFSISSGCHGAADVAVMESADLAQRNDRSLHICHPVPPRSPSCAEPCDTAVIAVGRFRWS